MPDHDELERIVRDDCIHRVRDCRSIVPGISECTLCGQVFFFVSRGNCGRYVKIENLTDEDRKNFDAGMESSFLAFMRGER